MRSSSVHLLSSLIWASLIPTASTLVTNSISVRSRKAFLPTSNIISQPCSRNQRGCRPHHMATIVPEESKTIERIYVTSSSIQPSSSSRSTARSKKRFTMALAFMTGCADIFFINKYETFCTMMTGNLLWICRSITEANFPRVGYYLSVIAAYIFGLVAFQKAELTWDEQSVSKVCAPLISTLFILADTLSFYFPTVRLPSAMMLSFAYGVINSIGTEIAGTLVFVVTGHMTKLTQMYTDRISRQAGKKKLGEKEKAAALQSCLVIGGFAMGGLASCVAYNTFPSLLTQWGGFTILGVLYGLLFLWQDRKHLWSGPERISQAFNSTG